MNKTLNTLVAGLALTLAATQSTSAQVQASLEFVGEFGEFGFYQPSFPPNQVPPTGFSNPRGVTFLEGDRIAIADYGNNKVQICGIAGDDCSWFGGDGSFRRNDPGTFDRPHGVEVMPDGRLVIADEDNHWVQRCSLGGNCIVSGERGREVQEPSSGFGRWAFPDDVAVAPDGNIYGMDRDNNRVQIIRPDDLNFLATFMRAGTAPGQLDQARGLDVDADGRVIISDTGNNRIQVCDTRANCTTFGSQGSSPGQFNGPVGVEVDLLGRIWVADTGNNRIQACSYSGNCVAFGANNGYQFAAPHDVAVHPNGNVVVADSDNNKIQVFVTESAQSVVLNAGFNDAWFDPVTAGQGYFLTVYPERGQLFIANFTFDTERPPEDVMAILGAPGHRWLTALGPYDGASARLDVTLTRGGVFNASEPPVENVSEYGIYRVTALDCDTIRLEYELPEAGEIGTVELQRISKENIPLCEALSSDTMSR